MCNNLGFLENKITLGCNLHSLETDYSYFWEIVDRYKSIRIVRMSITAPVLADDKKDKFLYYEKMKPIFIDFLKEAKLRNLQISFDCNQIPSCLLSEEEKELVEFFGCYKIACTPVVDITADFKASSCFGSYEDTLVDCFQFESLSEIERYFSSKIFSKTQRNNHGDCSSCKEFNLLKCQGGCLSFASGQI
jgi:hypothetical protein